MSTTVRLLSNYILSGVPYKADSLVSIDSTLATQLVASGIADNSSAAVTNEINEGEIVHYPNIEGANYNGSIYNGIYQDNNIGIYSNKGTGIISRLSVVPDFDPLSIPGLALNLDASEGMMKDSIAGAYTIGDIVASIPDRSGNGHTVTITGSPVVDQINGVTALKLNGTTQYLTTDSFVDASWANTGFTMFHVGTRRDATSSAQQVLGEIGGAAAAFISTFPTQGASGAAHSCSIGNVANNGSTAHSQASGVFMLGYSGDSVANSRVCGGVNSLISQPASAIGTPGGAQFNAGADYDWFKYQLVSGGAWGQSITSAVVIGDHTPSPGTYRWDGNWGQTLLWKGLLTAAQVGQVQGWLMSKWGFDLPSYLFVGDSRVAGDGSTGQIGQSQYDGTTNLPNQFKSLMGGESVVSVRSMAHSGFTIANFLNILDQNKLSTAMYNPYTLKYQGVVLYIGINDLTYGAMAGVTLYALYKKLGIKFAKLGYSVTAVTITPSAHANYGIVGSAQQLAIEANRVIFNNLLAADYKTFAVKLVDLRNRSELADPSNATYYADKLHGTDIGYGVIAQEIKTQGT
jgi:hypothetical protein